MKHISILFLFLSIILGSILASCSTGSTTPQTVSLEGVVQQDKIGANEPVVLAPSKDEYKSSFQKIKDATSYDSNYVNSLIADIEGIQLSPGMELRLIQDLDSFAKYPELKSLNDTSFEQAMSQDFKGSLATINRALAQDSDNVFLLSKKAGAALALGRLDECINILKGIVDYPPAIKGLAMCYFGKQDFGKSEFYTYRGLELMPNDTTLKILKDKLANR